MKINKLLFCGLCWILPFCAMTTVYSADETITVYFNETCTDEDTVRKDYLGPLTIQVYLREKEVFDSIKMQVIQEGKPYPVSFERDVENQTITVSLSEGKEYQLDIQGEEQGSRFQKHFANFSIHENIPLLVNGNLLTSNYEITDDFIITIEDSSYLNMETSFMIINGKKEKWEMEKNEYQIQIDTEGIYDIIFHFFDADGNESIIQSKIWKEYQDKKIAIDIPDPVSYKDNRLFYRAAIPVDIHATIVDIDNLIMTVNKQPQELVWDKQKDGYHSSLLIEKEGDYDIKAVYQNVEIITSLDQKLLVLDKTPPVLSIQYQQQDIYQQPVTMKFSIQEAWLSDGKIKETYQEKIVAYDDWMAKEDVYEQILTFHEEGSHRIDVECFDMAGNPAIIKVNEVRQESWQPLEILMDTTKPLIIDHTRYPTQSPSGENIELSIEVQEERMEKTSIELKKDGEPFFPTIRETKDEGSYAYHVNLSEDGTYSFQVIAIDKAGNQSEYRANEKMNIDTKKPKITLSNYHSLSNTNKDVLIDFAVQDEHLQAYEVIMKRNGVSYKKDSGNQNTQNRYEIHEESGTNVYEIQAWALDMAGNETYSNIVKFIIDKEPPTIQSLLQGRPQQTLLTNQAVQLLFTWQDAYIAKKEISVFKNGSLLSQQELTDENVYKKFITALLDRKDTYEFLLTVYDLAGNQKEATLSFIMDTIIPHLHIKNDIFHGLASNQSWTPVLEDTDKEITIKDTYLLKNQQEIKYEWGTEIQEEGCYQLNLIAEDSAGNIAAFEKPFNFEIDKTPPFIQLIDTKTGSEITDTYQSEKLDLRANTGLLKKDNITSLKINGHQHLIEKTFAQDIHLQDSGDYEIEIMAEDEAGNMTKRNFYCSIQETQQSPVYGIFLMIGMGGFLFILMYRKLKCKS